MTVLYAKTKLPELLLRTVLKEKYLEVNRIEMIRKGVLHSLIRITVILA
jgi:hypothetical protein